MAKKNGTWKIVLALIGFLATGVGAYTVLGCNPARDVTTRVTVLEVQQEHTRDDIKEIKGDVKEILRTVKER